METLSNVYAPYIGANGNWYINNEDTGVKAQGPEGLQGPTGPQGLAGLRGVVGDRGPQGIQGPIGSTGVQGPKGDKGDLGLQGEKGDTPELSTSLQETAEGKALDATVGKLLNDKVAEVNRDLSTKAGLGQNFYTNTQTSTNSMHIASDCYWRAQYRAQAPTNTDTDARAGYGFHNAGWVGGTLYLDNDGTLKFITSSNITYQINMTQI